MTTTLAERMKRSVKAATAHEPPDLIRAPVAVCAYRNLDAFYGEAKEYAKVGFFPTTVTNQPQRAGLSRMILLNFFALVWTPPPVIIVTYERR